MLFLRQYDLRMETRQVCINNKATHRTTKWSIATVFLTKCRLRIPPPPLKKSSFMVPRLTLLNLGWWGKRATMDPVRKPPIRHRLCIGCAQASLDEAESIKENKNFTYHGHIFKDVFWRTSSNDLQKRQR